MSSHGDRGAVIHALLLVQSAATLLASVGEMLLMANAGYGVPPLLKVIFLLVVAGKIVRGRRWAFRAAIVSEALGLVGVAVGLLVGLLPALAPSITLTSLLTEVALPAAVIILARRQLAATRPVEYGQVHGPVLPPTVVGARW